MMKPRIVIRIVLVVFILLLCGGWGAHSFWRLRATENRQIFNLYSLVPQNAELVFETDAVGKLLKDIKVEDDSVYHISELLSCLNRQSCGKLEDLFENFDKRANKALVSLHDVDGCSQQIFYCELAGGDYEHFQTLLDSSCGFSCKEVLYKGVKMQIYPLIGNHFLTVYSTSRFLVASLHKQLVEQVVETCLNQKSVMCQRDFRVSYSDKNRNSADVLYLYFGSPDMERENTVKQKKHWCRLEISQDGKNLCLWGPVYGEDSLENGFFNTMYRQQSVCAVPKKYLPKTTLSYTCWAVSDMQSLENYLYSVSKPRQENDIDKKCMTFFEDQTGGSLLSVCWQSSDSVSQMSHEILIMPLRDKLEAERQFSALEYVGEGSILPKKYISLKALPHNARICLFRSNLLTDYMLGVGNKLGYCYACFFEGCLLMASDADAIVDYLQTEKGGQALNLIQEEEVNGCLSSSYVYSMHMDMTKMSQLAGKNEKALPPFIYRHWDFFSHFILIIQYTKADKMIYVNIVLVHG